MALAMYFLSPLSGSAVTAVNEGFDDNTTLAGNGWSLQNLSTPVGSTSWFQGTNVAAGGPFDAYDGAANAYIGANYNNTGNTGTISNWLMTPTLDFGNSASLSFYTRKVSPDAYADRLEVRLSTNGASTNAGTNATTVGDFTTVELSINPTLVTGVYPTVWTQYTISGLPHNGQGRLAFRYYVTGAGFSGSNSDYIGIDRVVYSTGAAEYHVGGNVSGLAGSGLTLQLNGANDLPIAADGTFTFPQYVTDGAIYAVTVSAQPTNLSQTCTVSGGGMGDGSGVIGGADVTNVQVNCTTNSFFVGGNVSGLAGSGLTLQLNGANDLPVAADGTFMFPNSLLDGSSYTVTVSAQPTNLNQQCAVTSGGGNLAGSDVTNVAVTCTTNTYVISGDVLGLTAPGLMLQLNNLPPMSIPGNGPFAFPFALPDGTAYSVTVATQPPSGSLGICVVKHGSGIVAGSDVADVLVPCDVIFIDGFDGP